MSLSEYVRKSAGRWVPRKPVRVDIDSREDGTGMWLPAGRVNVHDELNVAGRWYRVTGVDAILPQKDYAGYAALYFDGRSQGTTYTAAVYVRDEAAQIAAQLKAIGGAR